MQKKLASVLIGSLLAGASLAPAAVVDKAVERAMRKAGPGETVKVIVLFEDKMDVDSSTLSVAQGLSTREEIIEQLKENSRQSQEGFDVFAASASVKNVKSFWLVNAASVQATPEAIEKMAARDGVKQIVMNETIKLEPIRESPRPKAEIVQPGQKETTYTYGLKHLKVPEMRNLYGLDGQGVRVGVIDTGVDFDHPDLAGKMLAWKDFVNNKPEAYDDQGHGTHVSGTIAGGATSGLAIGVAPGAKLVAAKAFSSSGSAQTDWLIGAMEWVTDPDGNPSTNDAPTVVSNSWGGGPGRTVFLEATKKWLQLGIFPSFAAGNSGPGEGTVGTPGGFLEAFAVGATTEDNTIASFSSRGPVTWDGQNYTKPDVSAPGKDVTSAKNGGGYRTISGTSMATPHVSGLIALIHQAQPGISVDQVRELLESTSLDMGDAGKDNVFGAGRVDALAAAQIVVSGGKINGKLTNSDGGSGLKGTIRIQENGYVLNTDSEGNFKTVLPEGTYHITASSFGFTQSSQNVVEIAPQSEVSLNIALERAASGTLKGKVVSAATGEELSAKISVLDTPLDPISTADNGGSFSIQLPGGSYKFLVSAWGYAPFTSGDIAVTANQESETTFSLEKLPPILVVDDDSAKDYEKYYKQALDGAGKKYSLLSSSSLASDAAGVLAQYSVVVWFTGDDYQGTLSDSDIAALESFLSGGGHLFISGQDIGYELKNKSFYKDTLKAQFVKDAASSKDISGSGLSFKIEGGDGANNQRYPDQIQALAGADAFLSYGGDNGPAGLKVAKGNSRIVYLAFGFEGIDTPANRQAVLNEVFGYLAPSTLERVKRIRLVDTGLRAAYTDLMAREAMDLSPLQAKSLLRALQSEDARAYGKVIQVLQAREVQGR